MLISITVILATGPQTLTPEGLVALVNSQQGVVPLLDTMKVSCEGEEISCYASWSGLNRKAGHEVYIRTSAGTEVFRFLAPTLRSACTPTP